MRLKYMKMKVTIDAIGFIYYSDFFYNLVYLYKDFYENYLHNWFDILHP